MAHVDDYTLATFPVAIRLYLISCRTKDWPTVFKPLPYLAITIGEGFAYRDLDKAIVEPPTQPDLGEEDCVPAGSCTPPSLATLAFRRWLYNEPMRGPEVMRNFLMHHNLQAMYILIKSDTFITKRAELIWEILSCTGSGSECVKSYIRWYPIFSREPNNFQLTDRFMLMELCDLSESMIRALQAITDVRRTHEHRNLYEQPRYSYFNGLRPIIFMTVKNFHKVIKRDDPSLSLHNDSFCEQSIYRATGLTSACVTLFD